MKQEITPFAFQLVLPEEPGDVRCCDRNPQRMKNNYRDGNATPRYWSVSRENDMHAALCGKP